MAEGNHVYRVYFGRSAAAPSTPTDPASMGSLHEIGQIPGSIALGIQRAMAERLTLSSVNQSLKHPALRTFTTSFPMNFEPVGNDAWTDLIGALMSDTDGVGASGSLGYVVISDLVAANFLAHGQAGVSGLDLDLSSAGRDTISQVAVTLEWNGDPTLTVHA